MLGLTPGRRDLARAVRDGYGIESAVVEPLAGGFAADVYLVRGTDGTEYFAKVWSRTYAHAHGEDRRLRGLYLMRALAERCPHLHVPAPVQTPAGALSGTCGDASMALFPFIHGAALPEELSATHQQLLGRALAELHRAGPRVADALPAVETFTIGFRTELLRTLTSNELPSDVRARVVPRRDQLIDALERLRALGSVLAAATGPLVLCHTDLGGDNALLRPDGALALLDWDEALVAPVEADLWSVDSGTLQSYLSAGGTRDVRRDALVYYTLRRALEDVTARLVRLSQVTDSGSRSVLLDGIDEWGFVRLARAFDAAEALVAVARSFE